MIFSSFYLSQKFQIKNTMSFLFGGSSSSSKQEIDSVFSAIQGIEDSQQAKIVKTIPLANADIHAYYKMNLLEMFEPQYANVRPKSLEIIINNYNSDLVENIDVWYLHTPLRDDDLDISKLSHLSNHVQFTKKTIIKNPQPYMTYCQTDEEGNITDVDISQSTNVNLIPDRSPFMSLGALIFQLNRKTSGTITLELTINLVYTIKKY